MQCIILEWEGKWALESITMNKASGGDGIPVELFKILKDDAVKVHLEALVTFHDSRVMTSSSSPCAWRHEFPGAAREAP